MTSCRRCSTPPSAPTTPCQANAKTYITGDFPTGVAQGAARWLGCEYGLHTQDAGRAEVRAPAVAPAPPAGGIEISFKADPSLYDGRYANNGWLQELPKQVTNMSWDNAALMSLDLMGKLGIEENEAIELDPQRPHDHHAGAHGSRPSE
jgi:hypothetical protein